MHAPDLFTTESAVQLRFQDKEHFFHDLAQMLRSGIPLQRALEHLAAGRDRGARVAKKLLPLLSSGFPVAVAKVGFARMDAEILAAGEQSGRLEETCERLSTYYARLSTARRLIITASVYPVFMLHLAAVLLSIPAGINGGFTAFFWQAFSSLSLAYIVAATCILLLYLARLAVRFSVSADRMLASIPLLSLFSIAALSRFCLVLSLGIRSADGILASLLRAGRASQSAAIESASTRAISDIRAGAGFAEALRRARVFPPDLERCFEVAEASGRFDEEMSRWADIYRDRFFSRIDSLSAWFPRLLYLGILLLIASRIFALFSQTFGAFSQMME